jgi:8-amino-3,8-dideoxy-alpha-D-manno-octulosonate transaminase
LFRFHPAARPGPSYSDRLEQAAAGLFGSSGAVALHSATSGLQLALIALGVCPGDRVAVPAYSFIGSAGCVLNVGAIPVFVDIDASFGMDPESLERALDGTVKAVIVAHLQGSAAAADALRDICSRKRVPMIEDCAQAFGATLAGTPVGTFGDAGVFSLQANKIIVSGEGGLVIARDPRILQRIRSLHDQGCSRGEGGLPLWSEDCTYGFNYKINEMTSAVALAQLRKFPAIRSAMNRRFAWVQEALGEAPCALRACPDPEGRIGVSLSFIPEVPGDPLLESLTRARVPARRLYAEPLYKHPIFSGLRSPYANGYPFNLLSGNPYAKVRCEKAESVCRDSIWIMLNPLLKEEECRRIGRATREALNAPSGVRTTSGVPAAERAC